VCVCVCVCVLSLTHTHTHTQQVVLCNVSKFYHIGTVSEYLFHLCRDAVCSAELSFDRMACSHIVDGGAALRGLACVMGSVLLGGASVGDGTVVEYSHVAENSEVGSDSIISGVDIPANVIVPDSLFLHTTCVYAGKFVTLSIGMKDNLKLGAPLDTAPHTLTLFDVPLGDALQVCVWCVCVLVHVDGHVLTCSPTASWAECERCVAPHWCGEERNALGRKALSRV
jgi:hypothetical protein